MVQELTSQLDKYQSVFAVQQSIGGFGGIGGGGTKGGTRRVRAIGISAEPQGSKAAQINNKDKVPIKKHSKSSKCAPPSHPPHALVRKLSYESSSGRGRF